MTLPKCGLYLTGTALPSRHEQVPEGILIRFHNHSSDGAPLLLKPKTCVNNKWQFSDRGYLVKGDGADGFLAAMKPLPAEGYYVVERAMTVSDGTLAAHTLVQIGYNPQGDPILFVGRFEDNAIWFPSRGYRFSDLRIFEQLRPAGFHRPAAKKAAEEDPTVH